MPNDGVDWWQRSRDAGRAFDDAAGVAGDDHRNGPTAAYVWVRDDSAPTAARRLLRLVRPGLLSRPISARRWRRCPAPRVLVTTPLQLRALLSAATHRFACLGSHHFRHRSTGRHNGGRGRAGNGKPWFLRSSAPPKWARSPAGAPRRDRNGRPTRTSACRASGEQLLVQAFGSRRYRAGRYRRADCRMAASAWSAAAATW